MTLRNQPSPSESLTDAEYDRMEAILGSFPAAASMDMEELDGFFAALICGPVAVSPGSYLEEIWGGGPAPFATDAELDEFLHLAMRHWNYVARLLGSADLVFLPMLFTEEGEEVPRGNLWAQGFLRGIELCRDAWDAVFQDEDTFSMLLSVLALAHEHDPDPTMRTWETPPDPELRKRVLDGLAVSAQSLYNFFRSGATGRMSAGASGSPRKFGRNDPCYCGSGKKYKKCCGNVTVQ